MKKTPIVKEQIIDIDYGEEIKKSFIDYAMSVIMQRAIPDVRDGLKPVHRRVLFSMKKLGLVPEDPFRKSARVVGDVIAKYHPHGDAAVYDAMVRMSQDFKMRIPLIWGDGNWGSIDGDSAAAMRYTESKMMPIALEMLADLEKGVVPFVDTYDAEAQEPSVLPARFPNLLVNGADGIAVGMKTMIPTHNLVEVTKAIIALIDNPNLSVNDLMKFVNGPDFPTGGSIVNQDELLAMYETGMGKLRIRAKIDVEDAGYGKTNLIITEIPYTYSGSKTKMLEKIADLARDRKLDELSDLRDESSKDGVRIVLEVKKGVDIPRFINKLYKKTPLEDTFSASFLALVNGKPETLSLKQIMHHFIEFQKVITLEKYRYMLEEAEHRKEVVSGLLRANDQIDLIIDILRGSKDVDMVKRCLCFGDVGGVNLKTKKDEKEASKLHFTDRQVNAILAMRLERLISLERIKLEEELMLLMKNIGEYQTILNDENALKKEIKRYLKENAKKYGSSRKTVIVQVNEEPYVETVENKDVYVLIDKLHYGKMVDSASVSRTSDETLSEYQHVFEVKTSDRLCVFSKDGNLYTIKVNDLPNGKMRDKGIHFDVLTKAKSEDFLLIVPYSQLEQQTVIFVTKNGWIKKVNGVEFATNRAMMIGSKLDESDELIFVGLLPVNEKEIIVISEQRLALRFSTDDIPEVKKNGRGVITMTLHNEDRLQTILFPSMVDPSNTEIPIQEIKKKKRGQAGVHF